MLTDSMLLITALLMAHWLLDIDRNGSAMISLITFVALLLGHHLFSALYKLYKKLWTYASVGELIIIMKITGFTLLTTAFVQRLFFDVMTLRLLAVTGMIYLLTICGSRFGWRLHRDHNKSKHSRGKRALIVGAGAAGTMVARQLLNNETSELLPIAFIDDDVKKHQLHILGLPVIGGIECIEHQAQTLGVDHIIIAIPSLNKKQLQHIYEQCRKTSAKTKVMPMLEDLLTGRVSVNQFRDVQIEDLLGREQVQLDCEGISNSVKDKVVLVTGAGGSIGSEICRQISQFHPRQVVLVGHGENSIYSIALQLKALFADKGIAYATEIADLKDKSKMAVLMETYMPDVVYHAAAHKHVPLMEQNPDEAVKNNVIGTLNVAEAADAHGVGTFVMISTDKAVNATSVMGATKRIAEMIIQHLNGFSHTKFVTVRFGNVLGSRGSVIPLFKKQIEQGGPVTVTDPGMYRYFMTIPEASRLVIQAGALAKGGEIFILDMGEAVNIAELAKNMIRLSGYEVHEIGIEYTGIRPGEKLFEELLMDAEMSEKQVYPKIYIGKSAAVDFMAIERLITSFVELSNEELRRYVLALANEQSELPELMSVL